MEETSDKKEMDMNNVTFIQNLGDGFYIVSNGKPYKRKWYKVMIEIIFKIIGLIAPIGLIVYGLLSYLGKI